MSLFNRFKFPAVAGILLIVGFISSCEEELTTLGEGVIDGEPFVTNKITYDVFAINKKIEAVQTNQLPVYQLGVYDDPVYGKTEASITSQVQLASYNPTFGDLTAAKEISDDFNEKEVVDSLFIYIPFFNSKQDTDNDGVVDALDDKPRDPKNDTDNDGVPNNEEVADNTNPNDDDTDNDGIKDGDDDSTLGSRFAQTFRLDSIYFNNQKYDKSLKMNPPYIGKSFNLKVERSTFFLRDLDPNTNFQEAQEFFSVQDFSSFTEEVFYNGPVTISNKEILFIVLEDDPDTDADEKGTISSKLDPGIYVKLNETAKTFFQDNIFDKEGSSELLSAANFKEFFRGLHFTTSTTEDDIMLLLDLTQARLNVHYSYNDEVDDEIEIDQKVFAINLLTQNGANPIVGNAVNTYKNEGYPPEITNTINSEENTDKIYLKGGAGSYAEIKLFDEVDSEAKEIIKQIKANRWIINEANLTFHIDTETLPSTAIEPPRLYLYNEETNAPIYNRNTENNEANNPLGVFLNYDGILEKSKNVGVKYSIKITEHINDLIVRDSVNATLGLMISPDIRLTGVNNVMLSDEEKELPAGPILSPLGTVLFGSNVPDENKKKLKLEIFYTETEN